MKQRIFSKNWARRLIFIFLLLIACPVVNFILKSDNLGDLASLPVMFMPGVIGALIYLIISFVSWSFLRKKTKNYIAADITIFALLLIFTSLVIPNASISLSGDEIDAEIRNDIHSLNEKIIDSIRNNEPSVMYNMVVEELKDQGIDDIKKLYSQYAPAIDGKTFQIYNEYYNFSQNWRPIFIPVLSGTISESEFYMNVYTPSNNTYISLLKTDGDFKDLIFSFVYVKINNEWRLHTAHLEILKIGGKTVPEWFQEAKELSSEAYNLPALLRLSTVKDCLRLAPFIQYAKEKEIIDLFNEIREKIIKNHKFPIQVSSVSTIPKIYSIEPQFVQMDLLPMIKYVTKIHLENVSGLQKEVEGITAELESIFPGITKNVSHIAYRAFSEPPTDPNTTYTFYGLTVAINGIE